MSAEDAAIAAIESAEAMTIANLNLMRSMKELLPKKLRGLANPVIDLQVAQTKGKARVAKKATRKVSAYSKRYGKAFKKLAPKYKKKNGQWKKDGFKRCGAAARKEAKR